MKDLVKFLVALVLYGGLGPALGLALAGRRLGQRILFALLVFMPSWHPGKFTMMLGSIETYRGHAKGFEISLVEVLSLAMIVAVAKSPRPAWAVGVRRWPPGTGLWLAWCGVSLLSVFTAWEPTYALMPFVRFAKGALTFAAAALYLRDEEDMKWAAIGLSVGLCVQAWVCLKLRVFEGRFQVKGWFEHQNPMSMWAYMSAAPVFALALRKEIKGPLLHFFLAAVGAALLCVLLSVSRAALSAYAACLAVVLGMAWLRTPGLRPALFTAGGVVGAVLVAAFAMDSLNSRLKEVKASKAANDEDLRPVLNRMSRMMLDDHPLTGIGWNNYGVANSRPRGAKYSQVLEDWDESRGFRIIDENYWQNPLTESLYWLWLAETGWLGWGAYVIFLAFTVWMALRCWLFYKKTLLGAAAGAILVALCICYAQGLVERILTQTKNLSHWLLLAGMIAGLEMQRRALQRRKA